MAQGTSSLPQEELPTTSTEDSDRELCAVCLEPYIHPAQLPCGHIFCFLCIKGTANRSKRCAMCRQEIPNDYLEHPHLISNSMYDKTLEGNYQWYYEGRNGWWQYDERTSKELEAAYKNGERTCELLIAGFLYVMDLEAMLQLRRNDPSRRRRIKRDLANISKIGIAGLRQNTENSNYRREPPNADLASAQTEFEVLTDFDISESCPDDEFDSDTDDDET